MPFKVGDRVIDTATGKRGRVRLVEARRTSAGYWCSLDLDDGRIVIRGADELTPDAPPTTV